MFYTDLRLIDPTGRTIRFDHFTFDSAANVSGYAVDSLEINPAPVALTRQNLSRAPGAVVVAGRSEAREVRIRGYIVAPTRQSANNYRRSLAAACGDHLGDLSRLYYRAEGHNVAKDLYVLPNGQGVTFGAPEGLLIPFEVNLIAPDPVAYGPTEQQALGSPGSPATVTNAGNAYVYPTATLTVSGSGTLSSVQVRCQTTGCFFRLDGLAASAGDVIEMVSTPGQEEVTLNGSSVYGKHNSASRWWALPPGDSQWFVQRLSGTATVGGTLSWRPGWVD